MTSFLLTLVKLVVASVRGLRDPEFRALFILLLALLTSGTVFYSSVEHWSVVDSLYFSVCTLSTVGYGDLHPTTPFSKIFTVFYLVLGVGIFVGLISKVAEQRSSAISKRGRGATGDRSPPLNTASQDE